MKRSRPPGQPARKTARLLLLLSPFFAASCESPAPTVVEKTVAPGKPPPVLMDCADIPVDRPLATNRDTEQLAGEALAAHRNCRTIVHGWVCHWARTEAAIEGRPSPACSIVGEPKP